MSLLAELFRTLQQFPRGLRSNPDKPEFSATPPGMEAGGALGYFLGGYVLPRTPNWDPILKKTSPTIPVLEMGQFFIPRSRIRPKTDTPF